MDMAEKQGSYMCLVKIDFTDPGREEDFNRWYNEVHMPQLLGMPGFIRGWRLRVAEANRSKGEPGQTYIAAYEIESPTAFEQEWFMGRESWDGLWGPYITNWSRTFYEVLYPTSDD
jgi:hypothetical protein